MFQNRENQTVTEAFIPRNVALSSSWERASNGILLGTVWDIRLISIRLKEIPFLIEPRV